MQAVKEWAQDFCNKGHDPIVNFAWIWMIYWRPDKWIEGYKASASTTGVMAAARVLNLNVDKMGTTIKGIASILFRVKSYIIPLFLYV